MLKLPYIHCYLYTDICILTVIKGSEDYEHLAYGCKDSFTEINEMIASGTH